MLVKKPDGFVQSGDFPIPPATVTSKPEVYFIKYKTKSEADQTVSRIQGELAIENNDFVSDCRHQTTDTFQEGGSGYNSPGSFAQRFESSSSLRSANRERTTDFEASISQSASSALNRQEQRNDLESSQSFNGFSVQKFQAAPNPTLIFSSPETISTIPKTVATTQWTTTEATTTTTQATIATTQATLATTQPTTAPTTAFVTPSSTSQPSLLPVRVALPEPFAQVEPLFSAIHFETTANNEGAVSSDNQEFASNSNSGSDISQPLLPVRVELPETFDQVESSLSATNFETIANNADAVSSNNQESTKNFISGSDASSFVSSISDNGDSLANAISAALASAGITSDPPSGFAKTSEKESQADLSANDFGGVKVSFQTVELPEDEQEKNVVPELPPMPYRTVYLEVKK